LRRFDHDRNASPAAAAARGGTGNRKRRATMAERVSGPYRGYYISAAARLVATHDAAPQTGDSESIYVGTVSLSQRGPDDPYRFESLLDLGGEHRFATEAQALEHVEQAARAYIDHLIEGD
jgi:hypothetical protein